MKQKVAGKEAKKGQLGPGHGASPVGSREDSVAVVAGSLVQAGLAGGEAGQSCHSVG